MRPSSCLLLAVALLGCCRSAGDGAVAHADNRPSGSAEAGAPPVSVAPPEAAAATDGGGAASADASPAGAPARQPPSCEVVGRLVVPRYSPSLSVLPDGRVLVAGGRQHDCCEYLRAVDFFDPRTRKISRGPDLSEARALHRALTLPDGKVLVIGGLARSLELFDPATSRWRRVGSLRAEVVGVLAAPLGDGTIYIAGGSTMGEDPDSRLAYRWDPRTSKLSPMPDLQPEGWSGEAFVRPDGSIAAVAGRMFDTGPPSLHLLDVSTGTFTPFSAPEPLWQALAMTAQRYPEAIVRGPDGRPMDPPTVLIEGSLLRFVGGALEDVALLRNEHVGGAAVGLPSGEILVVGDPDEGIVELCPNAQASPAARSPAAPANGTGSVGAAAPEAAPLRRTAQRGSLEARGPRR